MPILWDHSHPNYSPSQHDKPASHTVLFVSNQNSVSQELVMYIMYIYVSVVVAAAAAAVAACQFCGITAIQTIHHPNTTNQPVTSCCCCCCCCCCTSQHNKPASHTALFIPNQNSAPQELVMSNAQMSLLFQVWVEYISRTDGLIGACI